MVQDPRLADQQRYQAMLDQVERLRDRINLLKPRPGSQAERDVYHKSVLRRLAWQPGTVALAVSCDSMRGLRLMAGGVPRPAFAHLPLLRAAVDGATLARWLFDPAIDTTERARRGLRIEKEDLREQQKAQELGAGRILFPVEGERAGPRLERLTTDADRQGVVAAPRNQVTPTWLASRYVSFPSGGANSGGWLYAALSAAAHGRRGALLLSSTKADNPFDQLSSVTAWLDINQVSALSEVVLDLLVVALKEAERYAGIVDPDGQ